MPQGGNMPRPVTIRLLKVEGVNGPGDYCLFTFGSVPDEYVFIFQMYGIKTFWSQLNQVKAAETEIGYQLLTLAYRIHFARASASMLLYTLFARD